MDYEEIEKRNCSVLKAILQDLYGRGVVYEGTSEGENFKLINSDPQFSIVFESSRALSFYYSCSGILYIKYGSGLKQGSFRTPIGNPNEPDYEFLEYFLTKFKRNSIEDFDYKSLNVFINQSLLSLASEFGPSEMKIQHKNTAETFILIPSKELIIKLKSFYGSHKMTLTDSKDQVISEHTWSIPSSESRVFTEVLDNWIEEIVFKVKKGV